MNDLAAMYQDGASLTGISEITGIPVSTVRCRLVREGVELRSRADGVRNAVGRMEHGRRRQPGEWSPAPETRARMSAARSSIPAQGFRINSNGYAEFTRGQFKGVLVHRLLAAAMLGRDLRPDEVVHHVNGEKADNRLENLQVMTSSEHTSLHRRSR